MGRFSRWQVPTMNILIVGGAGLVGSIIRPAFEARYSCFYFDRKPVEGAGERSFVGDINDDAALDRAMEPGIDAVVNLAMGLGPPTPQFPKNVLDVDAAFDVNVKGVFRMMQAAMGAGVRRFVYASTLSVYEEWTYKKTKPFDESTAPDATHAYGMSKQLGELMLHAAHQLHHDAGIVALRLMAPSNQETFTPVGYVRGATWQLMGPNDTQRLFVAALERTARPGLVIVQATGDVHGEQFSNARATAELGGWKPEGN